MERAAPGVVRDAICVAMAEAPADGLTLSEVHERVCAYTGRRVAESSVRSGLRLRGDLYEPVARGRFRRRAQ